MMVSRKSGRDPLSSAGSVDEEALSTTSSNEEHKEPDTDSGVVTSSGTSTPLTDEAGMCGLTELVSSCLSGTKASSSHGSISEEKIKALSASSSADCQPFFRCSQFSNVPPTVRFYTKGTKVTKPNKKIQVNLTWCHNSLLPIVMRQSLGASHFKIVDESLQWIGYWGRHLKSIDYKYILPYQKVNHFPGAFHIGRKDRLWTNVSNQMLRFGEDYAIVPTTYILPRQLDDLADYLAEQPDAHVIIKPPAAARGSGIMVSRKLKEIKTGTPLIAQQYIDRPLTLNSTKFDLRLYAYVPSLEPLRVYLYEEGLVRFASVPYAHSHSTVSNKYMHLTNYSINKLAEKDGVTDSPVPKWRLTELWRHFDERGIDSNKVRRSIEAVIVKAFIACEKPIRDHMVKQLHHGFVCHELFGVDILLDEDMRPWLLEVNISPSLHSGTPLDSSVKAPLAKDVLNMAGIYITKGPTNAFKSTSVYSSRPRRWPKTKRQLEKETECEQAYIGEGTPSGRLTQRLTAEDVRTLVEFEDEYTRRGDFTLLFPTTRTVPFMRYFQRPLYANLLLQRWQVEQGNEREGGLARLEELCREGIILQDDDEEEVSDSDVVSGTSDGDNDDDSEEDVGES